MTSTSDTPRQRCDNCGGELKCPGCEDIRPIAEDLYHGWTLLSPFDRWENVERVTRPNGDFGPVVVYTVQCGPEQPWRYTRWTKVDAVRPQMHLNGTPIIRIYEADWGDGPMYAYACIDTSHEGLPHTLGASVLAQASTAGRGHPWKVQHNLGGSDTVVIECASKAKARTELRAVARQYARLLKVKVVLPGRN